MKKCIRCKRNRRLASFGTAGKGKINSYCRECACEMNRGYRKQSGAYHVQKAREHRARKREYLNAAKSKPCMDCGVPYPPHILDFDHRLGTSKVVNVSSMLVRSLTALKAEIAKCDVVCANCHRERTHQRRILE